MATPLVVLSSTKPGSYQVYEAIASVIMLAGGIFILRSGWKLAEALFHDREVDEFKDEQAKKMQRDLATAKAEQSATAAKVTQLEAAEIAKIRTDLAAAAAKVTQLEAAEIAKIRTDLAAAAAEIQSLKTEKIQLKDEVTAVNTKLAVIKADAAARKRKKRGP